jgi:putative ABC transport system permease protein
MNYDGSELASLSNMLEDLRYALRTFARNPGFALAAALTLALGIGANTGVFSLVDAILLRPLAGVPDSGRLVSFYRTLKTNSWDNMGFPDYADYRDLNRSFEGMAAHCPARLTLNAGSAERINGELITDNYFEVLGIAPQMGSLRTSRDEASVVISDALWERKFGRAASVVGTSITLNGSPFTIAGVAARGFRGTAINEAYEVWAPLSAQPKLLPELSPGILQDRAAGWIQVFARLKPEVGMAQAQTEMAALSAQLALSHPETRPVLLAGNFGLYPDDRAELAGLLTLLSIAVGMLLLIACSNVAGLFLVRAAGRTREIAIRLAVGASRARIVRQLLIEGLTLAAIAGALGLLLARWSIDGILAITARVPALRSVDVAIDGRVLGFTVLASLITGVLFAAAPAFQSRKVDLTGALKAGSPGSGRARSRLRSLLVIGQVALCFVLLSASAILLRGLYRMVHSSPGFETANAILLQVDATARNFSPERLQAFRLRLFEAAGSVPGVVSASTASTVPPYDLSGRVSIFYPGQEPAQADLHAHEFELGLRVDLDTVAPRFFETLGIPILAGREFTPRDHGVAILGKKLADRLWPGENPVGKRISWPAWSGPARAPLEIVGVAADVKYRSLLVEPPLLMYVAVQDNDSARGQLIVRTSAYPRAIVADVERAVRQVDRDVPVFNVQTMAEHTAASLWQQRMASAWIASFSLLAMVLAAVGLYTVIAQSVAQRTREVGIRMALGAKPRAVEKLIVGEGLRLVALGMAAGVPASLAFQMMLRRMVVGTGAKDPASFLFIACILTAILLMACWFPARRAARIDPIEALRCE